VLVVPVKNGIASPSLAEKAAPPYCRLISTAMSPRTPLAPPVPAAGQYQACFETSSFPLPSSGRALADGGKTGDSLDSSAIDYFLIGIPIIKRPGVKLRSEMFGAVGIHPADCELRFAASCCVLVQCV
jgi:hypothetical protein